MSVRLLDVNVLISLLDGAHVHHTSAVEWFRRTAAAEGWATSPITENGLVRIVTHVSYPNLKMTPGMATSALGRFKAGFPETHQFWPDELSISDTSIFNIDVLTGSRQITDAYLAAVAFTKSGRLATFDGAVPWRAVRGANAGVIDRIPLNV